ncbi:MAG: TlpA disulfide reductase family protein [Gemmatimonadaceae bacterium]
MSSTRRAAIAGATVLCVVAVIVVMLRSSAADSVSSVRRAPRFVAWTVDSLPTERSLDDYAGYPLLLNVWATWCDPCREEMPSMDRLYRDYRDRGLRVVAVSIDEAGNESLIREFVGDHGLTFDILHDAKSDIMSLYGVLGVPQTFLISRRGEIVANRFAADWSSAESRALVDSLLRIGAP